MNTIYVLGTTNVDMWDAVHVDIDRGWETLASNFITAFTVITAVHGNKIVIQLSVCSTKRHYWKPMGKLDVI